jgi:hypothetical protein
MKFGGRTTTYNVPSINLINTNDLCPNNTRLIFPKLANPKATPITLLSDNIANFAEANKSNGIKKPLITNYPKPFWYEEDIEKKREHEEVVTQFYWKDKERFKFHRTPMQGSTFNKEQSIYSISVSGGCIFTEGEFIEPNKLIFADGEEIFMAARAYTNGYDLLLPSKTFMYHLYTNSHSIGKNLRKLVTKDWPEETVRLEKISKDEIKLVLSGEGKCGPGRLGEKRTLSEYGKFCGLNFNSGEVLDYHTE